MRSARALSGDEVGGRRGGLSGVPSAPDLESSSDEYARRFSGAIGAWFLARQAAGVRTLLAPLGPCRVLEVGGGHAQLTASLLEAGHTVVVQGSDASGETRLRRLFPAERVAYLESPLDRLPVPDAAFDVVVTIRMLAHVENPALFFAECARVASRGVLVDYPSKKSVNVLADLLYDAKRGVEKDTRAFRTFEDPGVDALAAAAGLHPAGSVRQFFWPMALHRAHKSPVAAALLEAPVRALGLARLFGSPVLALYLR